MNTEKLQYTYSIKYLGFTFSSVQKKCQRYVTTMAILYTKSNSILQLSHCCTCVVHVADVKKIFVSIVTALVSIAHFHRPIIKVHSQNV